MCVAGFDSVAVIDDDLAAIAVRHSGRLDGAIGGRADRRSDRRRDVYAGMELALAVMQDWIFALAKAAGDPADHRPEAWRVD